MISDKGKRHLGQMVKGGGPSGPKPHDDAYLDEEMLPVGESSKIKDVSFVEGAAANEAVALENHLVAGIVKDQRKCLLEASHVGKNELLLGSGKRDDQLNPVP
jgi:hypothetical protein